FGIMPFAPTGRPRGGPGTCRSGSRGRPGSLSQPHGVKWDLASRPRTATDLRATPGPAEVIAAGPPEGGRCGRRLRAGDEPAALHPFAASSARGPAPLGRDGAGKSGKKLRKGLDIALGVLFV